MTRARRWLGTLAVAMFLAGCAAPQAALLRRTPPAGLPAQVELGTVPHFPQDEFQCGPATLAELLVHTGVAVTPESLRGEVYLPGRQGSLQVELMAAARRHNRIAYVIAPRLETVLAEVAGGNPVLVLLNLGLSWYPAWHYAVVAGYDLAADRVVLRSGSEARQLLPLDTFEHTWTRGGSWALVVLPATAVARTAEETSWIQALTALESHASWDTVAEAYGTALRRWPDNPLARLGLGNARHAAGDRPGAIAAWRELVARHPDHVPGLNNLAWTLAELGQTDEALALARRAVALGGVHRPEALDTLAHIEAQARGTGP